LAVIGGILYGALTYAIVHLLELPSEIALFAGLVVFTFYLASRLLILFSGIDTAYYTRIKRATSKPPYENTPFYQTAQWVGKFYHAHDRVLFVFLMLICLSFLISLAMDLTGEKPLGETIRSLLGRVILSPQ
jgi:hypothetical protein